MTYGLPSAGDIAELRNAAVLFGLALGFVLGWCAAMLAIALAVDGIWPFKRRSWQDMTTVDMKRKAGW